MSMVTKPRVTFVMGTMFGALITGVAMARRWHITKEKVAETGTVHAKILGRKLVQVQVQAQEKQKRQSKPFRLINSLSNSSLPAFSLCLFACFCFCFCFGLVCCCCVLCMYI